MGKKRNKASDQIYRGRDQAPGTGKQEAMNLKHPRGFILNMSPSCSALNVLIYQGIPSFSMLM